MEKNYRRCISCRKIAPKSDFWRIVRVYPSRDLQLDEGMGRSAYLCKTQGCLQTAQKKKAIRRSLRVPERPEIYQLLQERLDKGQPHHSQSELDNRLATHTHSIVEDSPFFR